MRYEDVHVLLGDTALPGLRELQQGRSEVARYRRVVNRELSVRVHVETQRAVDVAGALLWLDHAVRLATAVSLRPDEAGHDQGPEPPLLPLPPQLGGVQVGEGGPSGSWTLDGGLYAAAQRQAAADPLGFLANLVQIAGVSVLSVGPMLGGVVTAPAEAAARPSAVVELPGVAPGQDVAVTLRAPAGSEITWTMTRTGPGGEAEEVDVVIRFK